MQNQKDIMEHRGTARPEMNSIIVERQVIAALNKDVPPGANQTYEQNGKNFSLLRKVKEVHWSNVVAISTGAVGTLQSSGGTKRQMSNSFQRKQ